MNNEIPNELMEQWCTDWYNLPKDNLTLSQSIYIQGRTDQYLEDRKEIERIKALLEISYKSDMKSFLKAEIIATILKL